MKETGCGGGDEKGREDMKESKLTIKDCLTCIYFRSFRDDYVDEQEETWCGFCRNGKSPYYGNNGAGHHVYCDHFEVAELPRTDAEKVKGQEAIKQRVEAMKGVGRI